MTDGQLVYRGFTLGTDDTFMYELTGWDDLPPVDSGNSPKSMQHGSYNGRKFARERTVTWVGKFNPADPGTWNEKLSQLRSAFTITDDEYPITVTTLNETLVAYGSVTARAIPNDRSFGAAKLANVSIQFTCSDPRRYSDGTQTITMQFPGTSSTGLVYPLVYPLDYGVTSIAGAGSFNNGGDAALPAVYRITGPVSNPSVYNDTTGMFMSFNITLIADEYIDVTTSDGTVVLNGSTDRLYTRSTLSSPIMAMELTPGMNEFRVSAASYSAGAQVSVTAASAAYF